jgi:serine/threonine protein phosphatase 1
MVLGLFKKREGAPEGPAAGPKGPPGKRCYAIGDVHGCLQLLRDLLDLIQKDACNHADKEIILVFLGDLIDRGPDSRGVLDFVRGGPLPGARVVCLKGNHEEMFVRGLSGAAAIVPDWLDYGGHECAQSYGVEIGALFGRSPEEMLNVLAHSIPQADVDYVAGFVDSARFGDYLFVHAGVRPGLALDKQSPRDLRWIREEFLESTESPGFVTVHGHSISPDVEFLPHRIGVDTGAYATGVLSAIWIDGEDRGVIQARGQPVAMARWSD